jgi:hypothetical protein
VEESQLLGNIEKDIDNEDEVEKSLLFVDINLGGDE